MSYIVNKSMEFTLLKDVMIDLAQILMLSSPEFFALCAIPTNKGTAERCWRFQG